MFPSGKMEKSSIHSTLFSVLLIFLFFPHNLPLHPENDVVPVDVVLFPVGHELHDSLFPISDFKVPWGQGTQDADPSPPDQ